MRKYQTYLVRVWEVEESSEFPPSAHRFVLETVSEAPQRWKFDSFGELVRFLGAEFGEPAPRRASTRRKKSIKENTDGTPG